MLQKNAGYTKWLSTTCKLKAGLLVAVGLRPYSSVNLFQQHNSTSLWLSPLNILPKPLKSIWSEQLKTTTYFPRQRPMSLMVSVLPNNKRDFSHLKLDAVNFMGTEKKRTRCLTNHPSSFFSFFNSLKKLLGWVVKCFRCSPVSMINLQQKININCLNWQF